MTELLIVICIVLVLLPPKWDPAIRLKEWGERK
jgi:Sec-independent protein translocase protein TatA